MCRTIGGRIRYVRIQAGLTQEQLALQLSISYPTLSKYENGHRVPSADFLQRLVRVVGCDPGWLLTGEDSARLRTSTDGSDDFVCLDVYPPAGGMGERVLRGETAVGRVVVPARVARPEATALLVSDAAMRPTINERAVVIVDSGDKEVQSGRVYALWIPYEGVAIRRLFLGTDDAIIKADNPIYPPFSVSYEKLLEYVMGRVRWVKQEL